MRINKYLSESGYCSRRQADQLVKDGRVFINGSKAELGSQVKTGDEVKVNGQKISQTAEKIYLAYHKPVGVICTTDSSKKDNIIEKIGLEERIFPVGRLDVKSSGLILLTNDGDWANRLMHPKFEHQKEYEVKVAESINKNFLDKLKAGVKLQEGIARADQIKKTDDKEFNIVIHQGWNRQIRRMCEALGYRVTALKRIRFAGVKLAELPIGQYRHLNSAEIK